MLAVDGRPLEIQIRTNEMHQVAEYGVAAHWRYKEGLRQDQKFDAKVAWLRQLMDWQKDVAGGAQGTMELTFEVDGASKPSCVAEVLYRYYY